MRKNKWLIAVLAVVLLVGFLFLGYKAAKRVYRYIKRPVLCDNTKRIADIPITSLKEGVRIFVASSLDRIFQDGRTALPPNFTEKAQLSAAGNEYESFQVVVQAIDQDLHGVSIIVSDLTDARTGAKITSDNITWSAVGYVPTSKPYYPVKFIGPWPDPLFPQKPIDIKAGYFQPFWISIYVPPGTLPGHYTGQLKVEGLQFAAKDISIDLRVYHFTLPKENHLKTAFDFYGHITNSRYPQGENESNEAWNARIDDLNDKFTIKMLQYRMNPILNIDPTSQASLGRVDRYRIYGLNNFAIGKHGGTFNNNWPHDKASIEKMFNTYRTYGENLKLNGFLDYTYIYTWDEGEIGNPVVPKIASMIHRAYPGLKNMVCYHGIWDPEINPEWGKDIDIWTFQIDDFNEAKMKKLQARGMEMWMYISGPSGTKTPNLALDFDSIDYRIIPWICWKYDIRGFLYWCVNWWPKVDPFQSAKNTKWEQNGNGLLFYPGTDGPLVSLRMEIFRDGMEDYEYIQALLEELRIIKSKNLLPYLKNEFDESIRLLTMDEKFVFSTVDFTRDGEVLKGRRNAIAQKIEELQVKIKKHLTEK